MLLWSVDSGDIRVLDGSGEPPRAVVWAPDGSRLYTVAASDGVVQWDPATRELARRYPLPQA